MHWIQLVENPRAVSHLYIEVPPLLQVEVLKLELDRDGPLLRLHLDLPRFADHKPQRWHAEANTVQLELDFQFVSELRIHGFTTDPVLNFSLTKEAEQILVAARGDQCELEFACKCIYVQQASGYTKRT